MKMQVLYRKDNKAVIIVKPLSWKFSPTEMGKRPTHRGWFFGVALMDLSLDATLAIEKNRLFHDEPRPMIPAVFVNNTWNPTDLIWNRC